MMQIPRRFQDLVKCHDPFLRIRWSRERKSFLVERKVPAHLRHAMTPPISLIKKSDGKVEEKLLPENSDARVSYKDGYVSLFWVAALDDRLSKILYQGDAYRYGMKGYIRRLHEAEERLEKEKEKVESEVLLEAGDEAWHYIRRNVSAGYL